MTMDYYAGIDVSLEALSVCIVVTSGKIVREGKVESEPAGIIADQTKPDANGLKCKYNHST
jgi:hypothetical protein